MKSNIRERNDSAEQWKGGISFHSIYYRYFSFIFALLILFFYVVGRMQGLETLDVDLSLVQLQLSPREFALYGNGILLLVSLRILECALIRRRLHQIAHGSSSQPVPAALRARPGRRVVPACPISTSWVRSLPRRGHSTPSGTGLLFPHAQDVPTDGRGRTRYGQSGTAAP